MYNALKRQWDAVPCLQAKKHFPNFRYNLERGGTSAVDFIETNSELVESVLGSPDEIEVVLKTIKGDKEAVENKKYFFAQVIKILPAVKDALRFKYDRLRGYCEQESLPWEQLTPETLLPATRKAVETGQWEITEDASENAGENGNEQDLNNDVRNEVSVELIDGKFIGIVSNPDGTRTAFGEDNGEKVPLAAGEYRSANRIYTVDDAGEVSETAETPDDVLRAKIATLSSEGLGKASIWEAVKADAESIGWKRSAVWAYVDELTK